MSVTRKITVERIRGVCHVMVGDQVVGTLDPQVSGGWIFLPGLFWYEVSELPFWARQATGTYRTQREVLAELSGRRRRTQMREIDLRGIETSIEKIDQAINDLR